MSSPPLPDLDALSADGLKRLVAQLLARVAALEEENRRLREENARLKKLPKRPRLAPGGMERAAGARRRRRTGRGGRRTRPATEERVLTVAAPPGSRRKGYQPYTVQDLVLAPRVIRYRRERWGTPDGRGLVAPLPPEVAGHFGPGVVRFALMQHVQGQVTVERLLAQLRALGVRIAKGQLVALLTARKDAFHAETDAILEAGLATARWVTVDDTGARHAGRDQHTTHIGDDRFAWFATRPSGSRLGFLELLRAGRPDYVINAAAVAYMLERGVPEAIVTALLAHERHGSADEAPGARPGGPRPRRREPAAGDRGRRGRRDRRARAADRHRDRLGRRRPVRRAHPRAVLGARRAAPPARGLRHRRAAAPGRPAAPAGVVALRRPEALQGRADARPACRPARPVRPRLRPGDGLRRARRDRRPPARQQGRAAAGARPPRDPAAHQRLGERHPLLRHQAQDLRRDPLRGRQAGTRHLPRPAEDLRQARGVLLGLSRRPPQDPGRRGRPLAARSHPATGADIVPATRRWSPPARGF